MKTRKKKIMKIMLVIIMVGLQLEMTVASGQKNYNDSPSSYYINKQRKEIRSARDFRPDSLSTAPGFGKRKDPFVSKINTEYGRSQSVTLVSAIYPMKRTMAYWLLQHMRRYPNFPTSLIKIELFNSKKNNRLMRDQLLKMTDFIFI